MSNLTVGLLLIGLFAIALFLYAELVILKLPLREVFWRRKRKRNHE